MTGLTDPVFYRLHLIEFGGQAHTKERDWQAISYHYDLPVQFYALWLDQHMIYSCAYFSKPEEDLDSAQERKLDYICRKLRLSPGERLLDIGCGWGALIMHAAAHYDVQTQSTIVPAKVVIRRTTAEVTLVDPHSRKPIWTTTISTFDTSRLADATIEQLKNDLSKLIGAQFAGDVQ